MRWINACLLAGLAFLPACVELEETIVVERNGRVRMTVEFDANHPSELRAERVPDVEGGWQVTQREDDDGAHLTAVRTLAPTDPFPARYGRGGSATADAELTFPTNVTVEPRRGVTYYHFRRNYEPRPWADVAAIEANLRQEYGLGQDDDFDFDDLSAEERARVIRGAASIEVARTVVLAREAFLDAAPDVPQDAWLAARRAALATVDDLDCDYLGALVAAADDPLAQLKLQQEGDRFEAGTIDAMQRALRDADVGQSTINAFADRLAWFAHQRRVSQELVHQKFTIHVTMPGTIVASNANSVDGSTATWNFEGSMMHDRRHELLVTSRVP